MNKRIIRVFPRKTSYTPEDDYVFIGMPPFIIPEHDEVHVSCTFTWDKAECEELAYQWEGRTNKPVKLGGVAFGSEVEGFEQGLYVKSNIIFTSRGCNNHCGFCMVPRLEGKLRELPVVEGNVIQDNNFLQTSRAHKDKVLMYQEKMDPSVDEEGRFTCPRCKETMIAESGTVEDYKFCPLCGQRWKEDEDDD